MVFPSLGCYIILACQNSRRFQMHISWKKKDQQFDGIFDGGSADSVDQRSAFCLCTTPEPGVLPVPWWRHQMETFSVLLAICRGIHRSPVNSPHKGQWRGASMFSLICVWINGWVNNREAGDFRRYRAHYDVTVMSCSIYTMYTISFLGRAIMLQR